MTYDLGFLMEQVAGHQTNYRNLRAAVEHEAPEDIVPWWEELHYVRPGGAIERLCGSVKVIPPYIGGNIRMALEFHNALTRRSYDALLTNSWATMLFPRIVRHIPTIIDLDATPLLIDGLQEYCSPRDPPPVAWLKYRLCQGAYRSARLIQAWSTWAKRSVVNDYGIAEEKVVVSPPGVDLNFFCPPSAPKSNERVRLIFVGGDFARKGGHILLEAVGHHLGHTVDLEIATREHVEPRPGITVHRTIEANSLALQALYQRGDIFVLPSLAECFGLATVEAMACGMPVVVSDVGGATDIVEHGRSGLITKAGSIVDLARAIAGLVSDPARRVRMGYRSRVIAEQHFDSHLNSMRTLDRLRMLAGGNVGTAAVHRD